MRLRLLLALVVMMTPCFAYSSIGFSSLVDSSESNRPLALSIWYPSDKAPSAMIGGNAVFEGAYAAPDAPASAGRLPLVVVSHGGLRSTHDSGAWLSAALAEAGFMVVEVNAPRPGSAAMAVNEIWQRQRDISRAVDLVIESPAWAGHVDQSRIFAVGFALGGTAVFSVSGGELDVERYLQSCAVGGIGSPDCAWYLAQSVALNQVDQDGLAQSRHDRRFKAAVVIAPEYLEEFSGDNISDAVPTLLISLDSHNLRSIEMYQVERVLIHDAGSVDAFAVCTERGPQILLEEKGDIALCGASPEARSRIHTVIADAVVSFLADHL